MRRIRPATIVSSFCRATIAAPFSTANPKPKPPSDIFRGFRRKPKALGLWLRYYDDELADEEKVNVRKVSFTPQDFRAFLKSLRIECATDYEKYDIVIDEFLDILEKMTKDDELDDATQHDRVDKLAEIAADEELNAFLTNSFTTKLMIECEPKYAKRFRQVIEKVSKKMIRHDGILDAFELVTDLMSKFDPEYVVLLCEVLEQVREKITQDDEGENDNTSKIEKLAKLGMNEGTSCSFEEKLDEFVTDALLTNLMSIEKKKSYFMAYEVIAKLAKKVGNEGNENVVKIAEEKLDALVTDSFIFETMGVQAHMPYFNYLRRGKSWREFKQICHSSSS